ncbi:hypothetical protein PISMIDRAFT_39221, partial [Pisolithus microcarpus 441]
GMFGDSFYDQKARFSLNCQAIVMPHNLMIIDYALGQPSSVHDAYAFQGTRIFQDPANSLPPHHWIWADSAYLSEMWCAVPFKRPCGGSLTCRQNMYNCYVSKVHTLEVTRDEDLHIAIYWIMCCMILHNMIICFE